MNKYVKKTGEFLARVIIIAIIIILLPLSFRLPRTYDKWILAALVLILVILVILILKIIEANKKGPKGWIKKFLEWDKRLEKKTK